MGVGPGCDRLKDFVRHVPSIFRRRKHIVCANHGLVGIVRTPSKAIVGMGHCRIPGKPGDLICSLNVEGPGKRHTFRCPVVLRGGNVKAPTPVTLVRRHGTVKLLKCACLVALRYSGLRALCRINSTTPNACRGLTGTLTHFTTSVRGGGVLRGSFAPNGIL